jgi:outer membrane PBP1 activator LpoA protein
MDLAQILTAIILAVLTGAASTILAVKISQSVMNERVSNMKTEFERHQAQSSDESSRLKYELADLVKNSQANTGERLDIIMDYIKRVELNKADRSEVNLLIDATKRIEQKLDLLIRDTK